jgi:colanic acid/amylovoran biosynthesis glycosyltransferase
MSSLLMLSPAPVVELTDGEVVLDVKFVEGMKLHCQLWPGPVRCVLWRGHPGIDDPMRYAARRLGFELIVLDKGAPVPGLLLDEATMVYCAADDMKHLDLPAQMRMRFGKLVYTVEQALGGRMATALANVSSVRRRLGSAFWNLRKERALRRALREADGIHCNGGPAHRAYRRLNPRALGYLDNRIRTPMMARADDQRVRADRLRSGGPLRLVWFGQMTPESGVADLLPMARLLVQRGTDFRLEIIGGGPLETRLRDGIAALGLSDRVTLSEAMGFEAKLVPHLRGTADVFVMPRRLPTPLSVYVEAMGCGLPILGYANALWRRLQQDTGGGWSVSSRPAALVRKIERLDRDREAVVKASDRAVAYARTSSFETVFARRMTDLRDIAHLD